MGGLKVIFCVLTRVLSGDWEDMLCVLFLRWLGNYYVCANSVLLGGWEVMKAITLCRTALQFQSEDERGGANDKFRIQNEFGSKGESTFNRDPSELQMPPVSLSEPCAFKTVVA